MPNAAIDVLRVAREWAASRGHAFLNFHAQRHDRYLEFRLVFRDGPTGRSFSSQHLFTYAFASDAIGFVNELFALLDLSYQDLIK